MTLMSDISVLISFENLPLIWFHTGSTHIDDLGDLLMNSENANEVSWTHWTHSVYLRYHLRLFF